MSQPTAPYVTAVDTSVDRLRECAARFRQAIERCDRNRFSIGMQGFPFGSCGDATVLLGTYLIEQGLGEFTYALGDRPTGDPHKYQSHAWLEGSGLIVDITADQFPEITSTVIVTQQSDWHATFERDELSHAADFRVYDDRTVAVLYNDYKAILAELE